MSLESDILAAIQQAGAAAYLADVELKQATQAYAVRVATAMNANPFGLDNDALFENWKLMARLSQSMAAIEVELQKIYFLAEDMVSESAPATSSPPLLIVSVDVTPTDVVEKPVARSGTRRRGSDRRASATPSASPASDSSAPEAS